MEVTITPRGASPLDAITVIDGGSRLNGRLAFFGDLAFVSLDDSNRPDGTSSTSAQEAITAKLRDEFTSTAVFCSETACWQMHREQEKRSKASPTTVAFQLFFCLLGATSMYLMLRFG